MKYVENIRDGLSSVDPDNAGTYQANAAAYIKSLGDLDAWIKEQVARIPAARRLLVTNHESLGYLADRYGFQIVGTIVPSVSSGAAPSAQQLAHLIGVIQQTGRTGGLPGDRIGPPTVGATGSGDRHQGSGRPLHAFVDRS